MASEKPTLERAPIRVIELDAGLRQGAGLDDALDPGAAPGAPRRYSREIDPITAARIVATAAYAPNDRRVRHAPPRLVIVRRDGPAGDTARSGREVAAGEPGQVICSCGLDGCQHERTGGAPRDPEM